MHVPVVHHVTTVHHDTEYSSTTWVVTELQPRSVVHHGIRHSLQASWCRTKKKLRAIAI